MKKKTMAAVVSIAMALVMTACSASDGEGGSGINVGSLLGQSGAWVDSDLMGSVSADDDIRPQDDFAASINKDWKTGLGDTYYGLFQDVSDSVLAREKQAATDGSFEGDSVECLRRYYAMVTDWNGRNADGVAPLVPYIEDIASIGSTEELYEFYADPVRNPLFLSPVTVTLSGYMHTQDHPDDNIFILSSPELSLSSRGRNDYYFELESEAAYSKYISTYEKAEYILEKLGYSESEADSLIRNCLTWEKKVAKADNKELIADPDKATYGRDEAFALAGSFPVRKIFESWGFGDAEYFIANSRYMKKTASLCRGSNLKKAKAYLIVNYALKSAIFLDRETRDTFDELSKPRVEAEYDPKFGEGYVEDMMLMSEYVCNTPMVGALSEVYVENFFDDDVIGELNDMTEDLIDAFKVIFSEEEWLSDEGKLIAKGVPGFDYDLFFRSFANIWKENVPREEEKSMFKGDVHPLPFYRVNVGVQQFDEFYLTFVLFDRREMDL